MAAQEHTVFISRELSADSAFRQILQAAGWQLTGFSLIEFEAVPFAELPEADWLFFYSPRAVRFFRKGIELPARPAYRIAAVGPGTARALAQAGIPVDFAGTGVPEETAAAFARTAEGQRVVFPQARNSRQSVQRLLAGRIQAIPLVVYENFPRQEFPQPNARVLVFTSPMNVRAYCSRYPFRPGQGLVAIGQPTAEAIRAQGREPAVADEPSEEGLARAVLNLGSDFSGF